MKNAIRLFPVLICFFSCRPSNDKINLNAMRGLWKLVKYEAYDSASGKWIDATARAGYSGYILYDGLGHMAVQLLPSDYASIKPERVADSLSQAEVYQALVIYRKSFAYFADCTFSPASNTISHHRISSNDPREVGTSTEREVSIIQDTLILTAKERIAGQKMRLRWVRD